MKHVFNSLEEVVAAYDDGLISKSIINTQRYYFRKNKNDNWLLYEGAMQVLKKRILKKGVVLGVGINDSPYKVVKTVGGVEKWRCPYYKVWHYMLKRCYSPLTLNKSPTYIPLHCL